jgi:hypothetical protein
VYLWVTWILRCQAGHIHILLLLNRPCLFQLLITLLCIEVGVFITNLANVHQKVLQDLPKRHLIPAFVEQRIQERLELHCIDHREVLGYQTVQLAKDEIFVGAAWVKGQHDLITFDLLNQEAEHT